jgi:hypothetical protein
MCVCVYVCVCVCVFQHNSGTPGAISIKLGTQMTVCIYKNLIYIILFWIQILPFCSVSEFLLCVFAILLCSVSAPPVRIVPPQDVHRLLMLSAVMITCSYLGAFSSVAFVKTLDFILLYYYYMFIFLIFICMYPILLSLLLLLLLFGLVAVDSAHKK